MKKRILTSILLMITFFACNYTITFGATHEIINEELKPQWPIKSNRIFYLTGLDYYKNGGKHNGIDIGNNGGSTEDDKGEYIYPVEEGVVSDKGYHESMGYYVKVTHTVNGKKYYSRYMHFLKDSIPSNIKKGATVYRDTVLGRMGNTGESQGTHLHFDICSKDTGSYSELSELRGYTFDYYINNTSALQNVRLSSSWTNSNGAKNSAYWNWITANTVRDNGEYVFYSHTCPTTSKNENGEWNFETYGSTLGACKECHKAYNWQDTFQKTTTQVYELNDSNKNDKIKVYNAPYEDATMYSNKVNKKITVVGIVTNAYGNRWYVVDYQDDVKKTAYVYEKSIDDKYRLTSSTAEAKKYGSSNVTTTHTHNYNYNNGQCYCGAVKSTAQQTNAASTLKINLTQYPVQHTQGKNFGLRGTISSNYKIKKIYGYIKQNGNVVQSTEDTPNAKSVDVKNQKLNNNLVFETLGAGNYTLEVCAVDASGNSITVTKNFDVVGQTVKAESTLSVNLDKYPVTLNAGSGFGLRGSVTSNYNIALVKGYVINSSGQTVLSSKDTPNSTSMDIRYARLNNDLVFNNLGAGNYTMKVVATDNSGRSIEVSKAFTVVSNSNSNNSSLSINLEKYPVTIDVGSSYGLRGTITSNYAISVVRGYVINSSGQTVLSSKDTPNSTYMDIKTARLNADLIFNNLSAGNYTMKVVVADTSGRTVEATKNFTVKAKDVYVDNLPNGDGVTGTVAISSSWTDLSIRTGPSTNYQIVGGMPNGAKCTVYPNKTSNGWYYVNYNGVWGYASGKQINLNSSSASNTRTGIVNIPSSWTDLSIRTGPSTGYQIVGGMPNGARCTVYPDKASNGWYYVEYNGVSGYAAGNRINLQ